MSSELVCPVCGERYRDEDFCPLHGAKLVKGPSTMPSSDTTSGDGSSSEGARSQVNDHGTPESSPGEGDFSFGESKESKLASLITRLGLRPKTGNASGAAPAVPNLSSSGQELHSPLPAEVAEKGWRIIGPVRSSGGVDTWPVEMAASSGPVTGCFHRYRTGSLTASATYRRLVETASSSLARVWAYGTADFGQARADFDVVSLPSTGVPLDKWLADTEPSEERALHLFEALVRMLERISNAGLRPMTFEPSQILRSVDGDLCLGWVGAIAEVSQTDESVMVQFRPELARSAMLSHSWSAPELAQQTVLTSNAAVFSLGQVLAQAVWGQPSSHAELQSGEVPFHKISDGRLGRIMMGCLWPRSKGRWTTADLSRAAKSGACAAMPPVSPWSSLAPGASSVSFSFGGASYWRMEDLLGAAMKPSGWLEATSRIEDILDWAGGTAWLGQARLMRAALAEGRSADWVLIHIERLVRPGSPLSWRELDLTDSAAAQSLSGLAQRALNGSAPDVGTMRALFNADLRGAFSPAPRRS